MTNVWHVGVGEQDKRVADGRGWGEKRLVVGICIGRRVGFRNVLHMGEDEQDKCLVMWARMLKGKRFPDGWKAGGRGGE